MGTKISIVRNCFEDEAPLDCFHVKNTIWGRTFFGTNVLQSVGMSALQILIAASRFHIVLYVCTLWA